MKKLFVVIILLSLLLPASHTAAAQNDAAAKEPFTGQTLCLPGAYPQGADDCLPMGPSAYITDLAKQGVIYPLRPLNAGKPDDALNNVSQNYAKLNIDASEAAPLYSTLDDAIAGHNPVARLTPSRMVWVSYTQQVDQNGGHYLQLRNGQWVRASPALYSRFQGLVFNQNPSSSFGWIIDEAKPLTAPSFQAPEVGKTYTRETVVPIYEVKEAENVKWYMIGLNEWVERRFIRQFSVNTTPPQGVENNRWIEVNLYEQTLGVYENGQLLFAALIATGMEPFYTQPGLFQVYKKKPVETMTGAFEKDKSDYYYLEDVPWTMYFDKARALHGAYWRTSFGYTQSHGCVNLSVGDSRWIYDWAKEGDWVYVWDPSGETPTDPKFYSDGGA